MAQEAKMLARIRLALEQAAAEGRRRTYGSVPVAVMRHAEESPELLPGVARVLDGMDVVGPLGYGEESVVLNLGDKVAKIGPLERIRSGRAGPYAAPSVPGVLPYTASEVVGPLRVGVQDKVPIVRPVAGDIYGRGRDNPDMEAFRRWDSSAHAMAAYLRSLGLDWKDPNGGNLGAMDDGSMVVIDGDVIPLLQRVRSARLQAQPRWLWQAQ